MGDYDHLKMCTDRAHKFGYSCARCARTYCMTCDHASDHREVKTIVRYCPDWRCQRERQIEEGELVVAQEERRDLLKAAIRYLWKTWSEAEGVTQPLESTFGPDPEMRAYLTEQGHSWCEASPEIQAIIREVIGK